MNKQYTREEYEQHKSSLYPLSQDRIDKLYNNLIGLRDSLPKHSHIYASENCSGDMIFNSKNCYECFEIKESEDCAYVGCLPKGYLSYDCTYGAPHGVRFCYEVCSCTGASDSIACFLCWQCDRAFYSMECNLSKNIFGCVSLKKQENCIFNKAYTAHEWEKLALKIAQHMQETGEWGEFFDPSIAAFGYNQTLAQEKFPLTKELALAQGWKWIDEVDELSTKARMPDVLVCSDTGRPFKIHPKEVTFYNNHGLPIPLRHPNRRHELRLARK